MATSHPHPPTIPDDLSTYAAWQAFLDALDLSGGASTALYPHSDGTFTANVRVHTLHLHVRFRVDLDTREITLANTSLELHADRPGTPERSTTTFLVIEPGGYGTADLVVDEAPPYTPLHLAVR